MNSLRPRLRSWRHIFLKLPLIRQSRRFQIVSKYLLPSASKAFVWSFKNTEESNFYYKISSQNRNYLASTIALVTRTSFNDVINYFAELENDDELRTHISQGLVKYEKGVAIDVNYGRRVGWYAFIRITKPAFVVETGVDHGVGSCIITSALLRNSLDGFEGRYLGTEINPLAGKLLSGTYAKMGEIKYADSLLTLKELNTQISLFINDSDHSAEYERAEYEAIASKLAPSAIILGDNSHVSGELFDFSVMKGRHFLYVPEQPENHWYPGAGIGISFKG